MGDCEMTGLENVKEALVDVRDCGHLERFPVLGNKIIKAIEAIDADRHAPAVKRSGAILRRLIALNVACVPTASQTNS